jgi:glycosyltransferase involved in cell wall biosynthesis
MVGFDEKAGESPVKQFCRNSVRLHFKKGSSERVVGDMEEKREQKLQKKMLSVVVPVRNEELNIRPFYERIKNVLEKTDFEWEVIFVEDSSTDSTVEMIHKVCSLDKRFCSIFLTRSFGHHEAFTAGIDHASGECIVMMDGDLQHPPEFIPRLIETYEEGYDMVYAKRTTKQSFIKDKGSKAINKIINFFSDYPIDLNSSIFRIFNRKVANTFISMREHDRFITGMLSWPGFNAKAISFEEAPRALGRTKYSYAKMIDLAWKGVISFSVKPLRIGRYLGLISASISFLMGIFYIVKYLVVGIPVPGFTAIVVSLFFVGGLILLVLGIIGEYIGNIFVEIKGRPLYVVSSMLNLNGRDNGRSGNNRD